MQALKVVAHAIRYLKDRVLESIKYEFKDMDKEFLWVLTVPAIWDNRANAFMRKAAYKVL